MNKAKRRIRRVPEILTKFVKLASRQYKKRTQFSKIQLINFLQNRDIPYITKLKTKRNLKFRQKLISNKRFSPLLLKFPKLVRLLTKKLRLERKRKRLKKRKENRLAYIDKHARYESTVRHYFKKFKLRNPKLALRLRKQLKSITFLLQKRKLLSIKLNNIEEIPVSATFQARKAKPFSQMKKKERTRFLFEKERKKKISQIPFFSFYLRREKGNYITRRIFRHKFWKNMKKLPKFIAKAIAKSKIRQRKSVRNGFFFDVLRQLQINKATLNEFPDNILNQKYFDMFATGYLFKQHLGVYRRDKKIDLHDLVKNLINYAYPRRDPNLRRKEKEQRWQRKPNLRPFFKYTQRNLNTYFPHLNKGKINSAKKFILYEIYKRRRPRFNKSRKSQLYKIV